MNKYIYFNGIVSGIRTPKGRQMAKIQEDDCIHYEYMKELIGNPNGALAAMSDSGIIAFGKRGAEIRDAISGITEWEDEAVYETAGWNGDCFVYPDGRVFAPTGVQPGNPIFNCETERFASNGTLSGWLDEVAGPLAGQVVCEFMLGTMFAGPLRAFGEQSINPGFNLSGTNQDGKSSLVTVMASACGYPSTSGGNGYGLSFAGTDNGIEWEMQNYADLTMIIDEAALFGFGMSKTARGRALIDISMRLAEGREKYRYKVLSRRFRFNYVSTSNDDLIDMIADSGASQEMIDAVASRFLALPLKGRPHGIFDHLPPPYLTISDFVGPLLRAADRHHGHAMPHFLAGLVNLIAEDREGFRARFDYHLQQFREQAAAANPRKASRRTLQAFSLVYAAMRLAQHLGALPETFSPLQSTLACYNLHVNATLPPPRPMEVVAGLLRDSSVMVLKRGRDGRLSDRKFSKTKAFRMNKANGDVEFLMTGDVAEELFANWSTVRKTDKDIRKLLVREGDRYDTYRNVRKSQRDRMVCIRLRARSPLLTQA
ncbi:DUF927 domain-containing protein [Sphingomonas sp. NBWT7]|uniref:DUF927 domain-containing protein n=1 Tax=Sphingomonas sp. NBWT7 TaxID=2596913 RepID=UPI00162A565D|nr:DUF927 domain-containing protein [Sphingomonas sp. NBWT7]QNE32529.1 DUF927 domain-containing protein [Sphingomonas sp. NBWT7]